MLQYRNRTAIVMFARCIYIYKTQKFNGISIEALYFSAEAYCRWNAKVVSTFSRCCSTLVNSKSEVKSHCDTPPWTVTMPWSLYLVNKSFMSVSCLWFSSRSLGKAKQRTLRKRIGKVACRIIQARCSARRRPEDTRGSVSGFYLRDHHLSVTPTTRLWWHRNLQTTRNLVVAAIPASRMTDHPSIIKVSDRVNLINQSILK